MFQWKLHGGSCPFAGRCQFADSRIRRLGESHVLKIVGVEFQRRKDMQDISKFTSTNRLCVSLWDVSSCLSEDVFFNWASSNVADLTFLEGFTAFLVTRLPQRACDLADSTLESLKPAEGVDFQKRLVPIFKGDATQYLDGLKV